MPYEETDAFLEKKAYFDKLRLKFADKAAKQMHQQGCSAAEIEQKRAQILNEKGPSTKTFLIIGLVIILLFIMDVN